MHVERDRPAINRNIEGPEILKLEVEWIVAELNRWKTRADRIVIEALSALCYFDIDKITYIINEIYNSDLISEYLRRFIFRALPKKPSEKRWSLSGNKTNESYNKICHTNSVW